MRDVLLSGTAGFLFSCAGGFIVHRTLWKSADAHARQLDALVGNDANGATSTSPLRRQVRTPSLFHFLSLKYSTSVHRLTSKLRRRNHSKDILDGELLNGGIPV